MPEPHLDPGSLDKQKLDENSSLKGTFVSVMILGVLIIITWFGVWILYLWR